LKRERLFKIEKAFIRFFRKIERLNMPTKAQMKDLFTILHSEIIQIIEKHPTEKRFLQYFNVLFWLDSKITGKSMIELLKGANEDKNGKG